MTTNDDILEQLSGMTPAELTDLLRGLKHHRNRTARDEGTQALAAMFEQQDRTTADMMAALDEYATEQDTE